MTIQAEEIGGDHVLYGDWDDTYGHQFLVYYHPNGIHSVVFLMSGYDYGGGVSLYSTKIPAKDLDEVCGDTSSDSYERYSKIEELIKKFGKNK